MAFAAGSDLLLDFIEQDLSDLALMPSGSHIGQLNTSFLSKALPPQFLTSCSYDFLYQMKCVLLLLRLQAKHGTERKAHSVMEELLIYLCNKEAQAFIEVAAGSDELIDGECLDYSADWVFEMFDDNDIIMCLYSYEYLPEDHTYHFVHWGEQQFCMT